MFLFAAEVYFSLPCHKTLRLEVMDLQSNTALKKKFNPFKSIFTRHCTKLHSKLQRMAQMMALFGPIYACDQTLTVMYINKLR